MKIELTYSERAELLKAWKSGILETERISCLKDRIIERPKSMLEIRAMLYEVMKDDGYSDDEIEAEKSKILKEGEEPYYLMKYIEARRKRKEKLSGPVDHELMRRIMDAEIELVELGEKLKKM